VLILSATLILTMAGFGWVVLLRRRVEQRTEELRASEARFRNLAHHDPLTGAPNRALFQDRAEIALARAKRHGHYLALLLLDLDHFKPINDTYGHEAGDKVLCVVVERALGAVRKSDTVARLGGDEFAVLLSDLDSPDVAVQVAEKLLEAVCRPMSWKDREIAVSASIGVAIQPDDGICLMDLLRNADAAMYESKQKGSGGVERYRKQTGAASDREPALDRDESTVG
jgi:diguanylate cyclase (GGDEF)-like protein